MITGPRFFYDYCPGLQCPRCTCSLLNHAPRFGFRVPLFWKSLFAKIQKTQTILYPGCQVTYNLCTQTLEGNYSKKSEPISSWKPHKDPWRSPRSQCGTWCPIFLSLIRFITTGCETPPCYVESLKSNTYDTHRNCNYSYININTMIQWMCTTHAIHYSHPATVEPVVWRRYRSWTNEITSSNFTARKRNMGVSMFVLPKKM